MSGSRSSSKHRIVVGSGLLALGIAVFAVRLLHDGAYAVPRGGNLFGGLGALLLGGVLVWSAAPRWLGRLVLAASPVVLYFGLYATMAEIPLDPHCATSTPRGRPATQRRWPDLGRMPRTLPVAGPDAESARVGLSALRATIPPR